MRRIMVYDRNGSPLFELAEADVFELTRTEEINGEHALSITTTRQLEQGQRILIQDDRTVWREYAVYGVDAQHGTGQPIGTYYCTWSVQPDLMGTRVSRMPGVETPTTAALALDAALSGTSRWERGTVTRTTTGGASMYDTDGWDAMSTLVENWGGEVSTTIEVDSSGVIARKVDLYDKMGDQTAKRRFDFGADLQSVRRTVADGPLYCRITPRGKGEETDTGGYGRKITIESVNGGKDYLEYAPMIDLAKLPDGNGGWEYPTLKVENSDMETPADLKAWAEGILEEAVTPVITYTVDVLQLAREGIDMQGVSLGDAVQVVDRKFGDGLRLTGRVVAMTVDELSGSTTQLTIGHLDNALSGIFDSLGKQVSRVTAVVQQMNGGTMATADYLSRLLDRINTEINATGGYTYITEGYGIRTYDKAVSDPLVGAEADAAVEVKGGTIRIANSRTGQGDWDWKTVFTSGHIAAEVVTAASITTGYIGSASGGNYWDLDTGILRATLGTIGGFTIGQSALYNGRNTLSGYTAGVYLGTDGIATSNGTHSMTMSEGIIEGYYGNNMVGHIATLAEFESGGTVMRGLQLRGDVIDLRSANLVVKNSNSTSGDSVHTVDSSQSMSFLKPTSVSANSITVKPSARSNTYTCGMLTSTSSTEDSAVDLATKSYVDGLVQGLQNQINTLATKSYVDGLIQGLQTQINSKANKSELPTFSLSGTTLNITA